MGVKYDEKSCGVVLFTKKNGKREFLLLHYPSGHWDFPKGHIEEGENEHETAKRELWEETGIDRVELLDGFREEMSYEYDNNGTWSHKQVIYFIGHTEAEEIALSHEHQDFIWLPYDEALKKLTYDNAKDMLGKAENFLK